MKSLKTTLVFGYLSLFSWWLVVTLHGFKDGLANHYFILGLSLFFIIFSVWFVLILLSERLFNLKIALIFIVLGITSLGLFYLNLFYLQFMGLITGSLPLIYIFYILQFPLCAIGLILISEEGRAGYIFTKINLFIISILLIPFLLSSFYTNGFLDLNKFLIFFLPIKSLALSLLSLFLIFEEKKYSSLILNFIGFFIWMLGDVLYVYQLLNKNYFSSSYTKFLYLSGVFLVLFSLINLINRNISDFIGRDDWPVAFRRIPYQIPFSLNLFPKD